jgi:hypothetical protein
MCSADGRGKQHPYRLLRGCVAVAQAGKPSHRQNCHPAVGGALQPRLRVSD